MRVVFASITAMRQPASCVFAELLNIGAICGKNCVTLFVHLPYCCMKQLKFLSILSSVVTVSKLLLAVGFGRFFGKKPRFRTRFRFFDESIVNLMSTVAWFNIHNSNG